VGARTEQAAGWVRMGMAMAGSLDRWVDFETRQWPEYREVIVNLQSYAEQLVLRASPEVAARAARLLLDHGPLQQTSRAALAVRFPQGD
jgi:hypothetical protein